jgi:hypothetical protein
LRGGERLGERGVRSIEVFELTTKRLLGLQRSFSLAQGLVALVHIDEGRPVGHDVALRIQDRGGGRLGLDASAFRRENERVGDCAPLLGASAQVSPKGGRAVHLHEPVKRVADDALALTAEEGRAGEVDFLDDAVRVKGEVGHGREVVEVRVPGVRLLELDLRLPQLAVLHLELDLMHVQLVHQTLAHVAADLQLLLLLARRAQLVRELLFGHVLEFGEDRDAPSVRETGHRPVELGELLVSSN